MLSGPLSIFPLTSTNVNPEYGPIDPGGYVKVCLLVDPLYVIVLDIIWAYALVDGALLNPATCTNEFAAGAELNVIWILLLTLEEVKAVLGTPSIVMYNCDSVESKLKSSLVAVVYCTVLPSPVYVSNTL